MASAGPGSGELVVEVAWEYMLWEGATVGQLRCAHQLLLNFSPVNRQARWGRSTRLLQDVLVAVHGRDGQHLSHHINTCHGHHSALIELNAVSQRLLC